MIDPSTAYNYCETEYTAENIKGGKISDFFFNLALPKKINQVTNPKGFTLSLNR